MHTGLKKRNKKKKNDQVSPTLNQGPLGCTFITTRGATVYTYLVYSALHSTQ